MNSACPRRVSLITAIGTAGHSVSNHLRVDRGSPGCQRVYPRRDRLRLSLADSPTHADRIEFTAAACLVSLCYGLVVLVPLLSTSHCYDAVTVRYRTASHRTGADFHRSIPPPSQAHERRRPAGQSGAENRNSPARRQRSQRQVRNRIGSKRHDRPRFARRQRLA